LSPLLNTSTIKVLRRPVEFALDTPFGKEIGRPAYRQTTTTRNLRTLAKIVG